MPEAGVYRWVLGCWLANTHIHNKERGSPGKSVLSNPQLCPSLSMLTPLPAGKDSPQVTVWMAGPRILQRKDAEVTQFSE